MTRTVHVVQQDFPLEVTRSIERAGNKLRVVLDLYNPGRDAIVIHSVQDNIERLQQVNRADSSGDYVVSTGSGSWVVPPYTGATWSRSTLRTPSPWSTMSTIPSTMSSCRS